MLYQIRQLATSVGLAEADLVRLSREIAPDDCVHPMPRYLDELTTNQLYSLLARVREIAAKREMVAA